MCVVSVADKHHAAVFPGSGSRALKISIHTRAVLAHFLDITRESIIDISEATDKVDQDRMEPDPGDHCRVRLNYLWNDCTMAADALRQRCQSFHENPRISAVLARTRAGFLRGAVCQIIAFSPAISSYDCASAHIFS